MIKVKPAPKIKCTKCDRLLIQKVENFYVTRTKRIMADGKLKIYINYNRVCIPCYSHHYRKRYRETHKVEKPYNSKYQDVPNRKNNYGKELGSWG